MYIVGMSVPIIYNREVIMSNLQYQIAATISACVIATSTVLVAMGRLEPERYAMVALTLVAYWMPPPKKCIDKNE